MDADFAYCFYVQNGCIGAAECHIIRMCEIPQPLHASGLLIFHHCSQIHTKGVDMQQDHMTVVMCVNAILKHTLGTE